MELTAWIDYRAGADGTSRVKDNAAKCDSRYAVQVCHPDVQSRCVA
jgi:hypothetical protein